MTSKDPRQRATVTLLYSVRNRRALARHPIVQARDPQRQTDLVDRLPSIVTSLLDELSEESPVQRRRVSVLRKSDLQREKHRTVARELGLSRSQFYRDLRDARQSFAEALELRLGAPRAGDSLFVARQRFDARFVAVRARCLIAELQTESGKFGAARETVRQARALIPDVAEPSVRSLLEATCDLAEFEIAHCEGAPPASAERALVIERLRRGYASREPAYAVALAHALMDAASVLFERDDTVGAQQLIDEASAIVARERLEHTKVGVDVEIRASGIRAVAPERVNSALHATAAVVESASEAGDARALRVGTQMMSAHLLTLGRLDEARHFALEAYGLIDLFGSALDRLIVLSNLARIEIHRGDGPNALHWIGLAEAMECKAFSISQALRISRAEALVLIGQADTGAKLARTLSSRLRQWPRLLGRAKLAEAAALSALNRVSEARTRSAEAVELSRGSAGPLLHLRALDLNVRLTGNPAAKAELCDLQCALQTP